MNRFAFRVYGNIISLVRPWYYDQDYRQTALLHYT